MNSGLTQRIRTWAQGALADKRAGRFLLTQLAHSATTVVVLAALLLGAARVGALEGVLAPATAVNDTSFTTVNYQGRLADSGGAPIDNTNPGLGMTFALYDVESGGSPLWTETHANIPVAEGLFSVRLGSVNALDTSHLTGDRWLGIQVGTDPEMSPREKLTAVPYAMQAGLALTVPDGSITTAKLDIDGNLNLGSNDLVFDSLQGAEIHTNRHVWFRSDSSTWTSELAFDAAGALLPGVDNDMKLGLSNKRWSHIYAVNTHFGAIIENGLQTPDELIFDCIARFSEGDVLCWGEGRLELCAQVGDPLVQAVADENGKPIVIGAEVIRVLGPVHRGDLLVTSDVPGCAMVDNNPRPGTVIAQALEDFDPSTISGRGGEQGLIRAMIRKF